jgi:hypothetical protein
MKYPNETAYENADPYEGRCDENRCVKGKKCTECKPKEKTQIRYVSWSNSELMGT